MKIKLLKDWIIDGKRVKKGAEVECACGEELIAFGAAKKADKEK